MTWDKRSKSERQKIRKEMLKQANILLEGLYPSAQRRREAAKIMVDLAIEKERKGE